MPSSVSPFSQTLGNICVGIAAFVVVLPLNRLLSDYANRNPSDNQWVSSALLVVVPLWLLLMVALLCVTASGGFDWLPLGRPAQYVFTVAAAIALAAVSLMSIGMYIRPGFTPRGIYVPVIYLVPLTTALLVVLSVNAKLAPGMSMQWLRMPWTILATVSIVGCFGFAGQWMLREGMGGVMGFASRIRNPGPSSEAIVAQISALDPQRDFDALLRRAGPGESDGVRDAATARLRTNPEFIKSLAAALNSRDPSNALGFLYSASLSSDELRAVASPARNATERVTSDIPAPNYMTSDRRKQLLRWGKKILPVIVEKFSGTDVDFSKVVPEFEYALRPDDTRR